MSAFTPGPWMAATKPSSVVGWPVVAQTGRSICSVRYHSEHSEVAAECTANANLIAAAPDMYEALENIVILFEPRDDSDVRMFKAAQAALAKAEGRTP